MITNAAADISCRKILTKKFPENDVCLSPKSKRYLLEGMWVLILGGQMKQWICGKDNLLEYGSAKEDQALSSFMTPF